MTVKRRDFLKLLLASVSVAGLSPAVAYGLRTYGLAGAGRALDVASRSTVAGSEPGALASDVATPTTMPPASAAGVAELAGASAARPRGAAKKTLAWLRMQPNAYLADSAGEYGANRDRIQIAVPLNGGKLQGDGTWLQEGPKTGRAWPRSLPQLARGAGQLYMPGVGNDRSGIVDILGSADLRARAAANLVSLAMSGRYDSPWDGVYLDLEGVDPGLRQPMTDLLSRIADGVKAAGLKLGISVSGIDVSPGGNPELTEAQDMQVVGKIADFVDVRCYDYWSPSPRSIGPYWWAERSIEFALAKGIAAEKLTLGLASFSRLWPDRRSARSQELTYAQAMQVAQQADTPVAWVESNPHGLVREKHAAIGSGDLWVHDADTYRAGLELADRYGLMGTAMFSPGMGDPAVWGTIAAWQENL